MPGWLPVAFWVMGFVLIVHSKVESDALVHLAGPFIHASIPGHWERSAVF